MGCRALPLGLGRGPSWDGEVGDQKTHPPGCCASGQSQEWCSMRGKGWVIRVCKNGLLPAVRRVRAEWLSTCRHTTG